MMSLVAPEARDCLHEGPGLPPKWPYRLTPDCSGPAKVGGHARLFQSDFSMAPPRAIAAIALTNGLPGGNRYCRATAFKEVSQILRYGCNGCAATVRHRRAAFSDTGTGKPEG